MGVGLRTKNVAAALALVMALAGAAFAASVTSESTLSAKGVQKSEVSVGDLVADAIRSALGTDIAFISASELKEQVADLPKGNVSTEDVAAFVAYTDDPIVEMKLTGRQVKLAIERSVLIYPKNNLGFLQVSGISFTFDPGRPQEDRVTSVKLGNKEISDNTTYTVAMTSSMANGALGYWKIWSKDDRSKTTEMTIPDAIDKFFAGRSKINYSNLNRIIAK